MSKRAKAIRRRPCEICGELFRPNPKVGERQYVCSKPECQRERHRRNCQKWREQQRPREQAERFTERLLTQPLPPASPKSSSPGPPRQVVPRAGPSSGQAAPPSSMACFNWALIEQRWGVELVVVLKLILSAAQRGG